MKSLVSDIKTSTKDRIKFIRDNQKDTHELLAGVAQKLEEGEKDRISDFRKLMKDIREGIQSIQARVKNISDDTGELRARFKSELKEMTKDLNDFLAQSERARMADFKTTMGDIRSSINDIQSRVHDIKKHAVDLLGDYEEERAEASAHWGTLRKQERAPSVAEEEEEPKRKKRGPKKAKSKR